MHEIKKSNVSGKKGRYANVDSSGGVGLFLSGIVTLDSVYDALSEMIFTKDIKGRITSTNNIFAEYSLMTKSELIGKTARDLTDIPRENAEEIMRIDERVMKTRKPHTKRQWIKFSNGRDIYTEQVTTPIIENDKVLGVLVTIRDLTELKLAMDEVEYQNEMLKTIGQVSALLLEPDLNTFKQSIYEAMRIIAGSINADRIDIWRLRYSDGIPHYTLEYDWSLDKDNGEYSPEDTDEKSKDKDPADIIAVDEKVIPFMETILTKGKAINRPVSEMPAAAQDLFKLYGIDAAKSALIMPIIQNDEYWGFIGAFDMENERTFSDNEELLLRSSRRMIASAMTRIEITRDLMHKSVQLQYEVDAKRDFLARMSHEIRTPMNAILGMTELALRERMSNAANEHLMTVKQTGNNLLSIINDILDFSKIESGNMDIIEAEYALSSLIFDIVSIIRMRLAYTRTRFIVDVDSNLPAFLIGDEGKIRQILVNLLTNAVKYTQKGFIKFTVRGQMQEDGTIKLITIVTDSGIGIKEEDQAKLFRDYIQVDNERNAGIEGVGLGLSICQGLTSAMNGKISLTSVYGEGSEFTVEIPQKVASTEKIAKVKNPDKAATLIYERRSQYVETLVSAIENLGVGCDVTDKPEDALEKMRTGKYSYIMGSKELLLHIKFELEEIEKNFEIIGITEFGDETDSTWRTLSTPIHTISLVNVYNNESERYMYTSDDDEVNIRFSAPEAKVLVVDDISTNLKVAAGLLAVYDVDIDISGGGAEAVELVRENHYDIIFMDHRMPGIDGMEATKMIRALEGSSYFKEVPIIALTANVVSNVKEMFIEAGFNDFLPKPIDTVMLGTLMRKWIPKTKQRRYFAVEESENKGTAETSGMLTIPGVDVDKGFRTSGGKMELYLEILATFLDEADERTAQLHEYIESGNMRMYTITVHALKGALANIGAEELSGQAAKLEAAGDRKDKEFIVKNNERFISGLGRLLASIKTVLTETAKNTDEEIPESGKSAEEFLETLKDLQKAVSVMDAGAMNKDLEKLLSEALTEQKLSTVRIISKHILMAEYDDAETLIADLIKALEERGNTEKDSGC